MIFEEFTAIVDDVIADMAQDIVHNHAGAVEQSPEEWKDLLIEQLTKELSKHE